MEQLIPLLYVDEPMGNGVTYPANIVEQGCQNLVKRIALNNGVFGEWGVPPKQDINDDDEDAANSDVIRFMTYDPNRISHIVKHVWIDGATLTCKIQLLGKYAEIAKSMDTTYHAIPRVLGYVDTDTKICTQYNFITVDLSFMETFPYASYQD
jgi:hypothetical protein